MTKEAKVIPRICVPENDMDPVGEWKEVVKILESPTTDEEVLKGFCLANNIPWTGSIRDSIQKLPGERVERILSALTEKRETNEQKLIGIYEATQAREKGMKEIVNAQNNLISNLVGKTAELEQSEFMSVAEASSWLGIPARSLREYIKKGTLTHYKFGRHRKLRRSDLLNLKSKSVPNRDRILS